MMENAKSRTFTRYASAIVVGCVGFCAALFFSGAFSGLELKTVDFRFRIRDWGRHSSISPEIALIEIDDESSKVIPEPSLIWDPYFTKVISALLGSNPKAIALDVLWLRSIEDFVELKNGSIRKPLVQAFLKAASENKLVLALSPKAEEVSLGKHSRLIGAASFADVTLEIDEDKVVRRQTTAREAQGAGEFLPTFPALAAEKAGASLESKTEPFLINFTRGPLPFAHYSFAEVLRSAEAGDLASLEKRFQGKIVLIGTTNSLLDRHPTPIGPETPGIYIHAFAVKTLLGEKLPHSWGALSGLAIIFFLSIAAGFSAWIFSPLLAIGCGLGLGALYLMAGIFLFSHLEVIPLAGPLFSIACTLGCILGFRFAVVDRERRQLASTFRRYMNSKIVDLLMNSPEAAGLAGSKREVCVLFSDIRGFTKLSEGLLPEQVVSFLNTYLSAMSQIILDYDGTVDKFIGDGIMAYFGAPLEDPNAATNGVRAALAMQEKLAELNAAWKTEGKAELKIGIGIHLGNAVIGNIGSSLKMDYTAIGDAVNLASRVESMTKDLKREILITSPLQARVKDLFELEDVGEVPIRGRSAIQLFAVYGEKK